MRTCYLLSVPFWIQTRTHPCTSHRCTAWDITFISTICHLHCYPRLFLHNTCRTSDGPAGVWSRTWAGIRYANVGGVTISDPDCYVTVGVIFWFVYFSVFFYSRDLHKKETMLFEAHCMSFPCTEIVLLTYAEVNTVFHSMAPLSVLWSCIHILGFCLVILLIRLLILA